MKRNKIKYKNNFANFQPDLGIKTWWYFPRYSGIMNNLIMITYIVELITK